MVEADAARCGVKDAIERWETERRFSVRDTRDLLDAIMGVVEAVTAARVEAVREELADEAEQEYDRGWSDGYDAGREE